MFYGCVQEDGIAFDEPHFNNVTCHLPEATQGKQASQLEAVAKEKLIKLQKSLWSPPAGLNGVVTGSSIFTSFSDTK